MVERIIDLENHAWRHLFISHTRRFFLPSIDYRTYRLHIYIYIYIDNRKGSDKYLSSPLYGVSSCLSPALCFPVECKTWQHLASVSPDLAAKRQV